MKPFDIEAAKAGKPFTRKDSWKDCSRKFLGIMSNGDVAYEFKERHGDPLVAQARPDQLFMIAEKKTYTVCLVRMVHSKMLGSIKKENLTDYMEVIAEYTFEYEE